MVQVHRSEGVASHTGPDACVDDPRGRGEALTGERIGQPLSRESEFIPEADAVPCAEGNIGGSVNASVPWFRRGRLTLACAEASRTGIGRTRDRPIVGIRTGPHREGEEP
jgi:hypothetical protein